MVSCTGLVTVDTDVPTMSVSMTMSMMIMHPHTTVAFILSGSTLFGSQLVDHDAEEPSASVSEATSLFKKKKKRDMNYAPNQVKLLFAAPSCFVHSCS